MKLTNDSVSGKNVLSDVNVNNCQLDIAFNYIYIIHFNNLSDTNCFSPKKQHVIGAVEVIL